MSTAASLIKRLAARQVKATGALQRNTPTKDNSGSEVDSWATVYPTVTFHLQLTSGSEGVRYGRENNREFGKAFCDDASLDIRGTDRFVWNSRTFDIQSARIPGSMRPTDRLAYWVMDVEETQD